MPYRCTQGGTYHAVLVFTETANGASAFYFAETNNVQAVLYYTVPTQCRDINCHIAELRGGHMPCRARGELRYMQASAQ
jgi:hypothetical protein